MEIVNQDLSESVNPKTGKNVIPDLPNLGKIISNMFENLENLNILRFSD